MKHTKYILTTGAFSAAIAVIAGAFGTHTLSALIEIKKLNTFEVAVRYQMYHSLALLICGLILERKPHRFFRFASYFFIGGIFIFSGTLYLLSTSEIWSGHYLSWLGAITPIGGFLLIIGWILFGLAVMKSFK